MQLLMRRPEIAGFVSVAPPASMYDFTFLAPCPSSGLIVQGEKDSLVPESSVSKLVSKLQAQRGIEIDYRVVPGADHFFKNEMDLLSEHVADHLQKAKAPAA
jgi:alpha/beta superfamily hydrolase